MDQDALSPAPVDTSPGEQYEPGQRPFQGIPGIEAVGLQRLFATWYSCRASDLDHSGEGPTNYVILARSDDGGATWLDPALVIDPHDNVRAFDPCLWVDPLGRLWLFWAQSLDFWDGRAGVWAICCDRPNARSLCWSPPRRLCNGIMMNKPTVLGDGTWLLPAAVWGHAISGSDASSPFPELAGERFPNVVASTDQGATWMLRGSAEISDRAPDEHMVVELTGGRLWMLIRTRYGIGQSFSDDGGSTWSPGEDSGLGGPNSRFFVRRLRSGCLLLVNHRMDPEKPRGRRDLEARLSDDEGNSWIGGLMLDDRDGVSYPDGIECDDGRIRIIYDRNRKAEGEILVSTIGEQDILTPSATRAPARGTVISALGIA